MLLQKRLYWLDIGRLVEQSQIFPLDLRVFICFARVVACGLVVASPLFNDEAVRIALAAKDAFRLRLRVKLPQFHKQHALLVQQHACHFGISVLQLLERSGILCRKRAHRTDIPMLKFAGRELYHNPPRIFPRRRYPGQIRSAATPPAPSSRGGPLCCSRFFCGSPLPLFLHPLPSYPAA